MTLFSSYGSASRSYSSSSSPALPRFTQWMSLWRFVRTALYDIAISQGIAFSAQYSIRNASRHSLASPSSSGTSERPWTCGPGVPPASSMKVGAMSWQMIICFTRVPARTRRG